MGKKFIVLLVLIIGQCYVPFRLAVQPQSARAIASSSPIFKEVAEQVGLKLQHYNGMTGKLYLPEIMGSGAALFDFDNDGDLDVFFVEGSVLEPGTKPATTQFPWRGPELLRGRLFRNDLVVAKDGSRTLKFNDVTEKSGIVADGYGMGLAVGDINNDGWSDLYITNLGRNQMYLNKGDGTFSEVTRKTETDDPRWSTSTAFFDYDRDGWLDLMVVNYANFSVTNRSHFLQAALSVDPNDLNARFLLARELVKSKRLEEALAEFSRVVQADPDNEEALLEQVKLLQLRRQYKQSLETLEKGHARSPQKGQTIVMLAYLLAASPRYDLRDGARALNFAQLVYKQTGSLQHGALVAMALAELGRCGEAAEWQRRLIAVAEQEHKTDLLAKLRTGLKQYEKGQPCRPEADTASPGNPK